MTNRSTTFDNYSQSNWPGSSAFSLEAAEKWALERSENLPDELFRLTAIWYINFVRQPVPGERKTRYIVKLAQAQNYGISIGLSPHLPEPNANLVGEDSRQVLKNGTWGDEIERTALVDLVISYVSRPADQQIRLEGSSHAKYSARSTIFADEVASVLQTKGSKYFKGNKPRVLVIGATAAIIKGLLGRGFDVSATDLAPEIIDHELGGVKIRSGEGANERLIAEADLAVVTGMTLPNGSLPSIVEQAAKCNTSILIWAITGRNFGDYYTKYGVDAVISDPSPFLHLPGAATIAIWRKKAGCCFR
jgi:hypothetical protein